jgi:hypothetical protein
MATNSKQHMAFSAADHCQDHATVSLNQPFINPENVCSAAAGLHAAESIRVARL